MRVQKRASSRVVSSAPKIKPTRKIRRHKWQIYEIGNWYTGYRCERCGRATVISTEDVAAVRPQEFGCIPAVKNT